ncbi:MAG: RecX family transcriptional regulator [Bacilli bacterium]|nr:RecX family transcriptional regulator [Bacilli bacterium]
MKIIKYTKLKNNKYKVLLDNSEELTLYDDVILNNDLLINKEIKNINNILKENSYYDAYFLGLKMLEKKLRTKKELRDYLIKKYDKDIVDKAMEKIVESGYLNDELYVKSYIHDQIILTNNGYYKILRDLKNKDINEELIINYLNEIESSIWLDKINKIVSKKINNNSKYSASYLKEKLLYDLSNLGYKKEDIYSVISNYEIKDNNDILQKTYNSLYFKLSKKYSGKELNLQLLNKLMAKGFNYSEVKNILK